MKGVYLALPDASGPLGNVSARVVVGTPASIITDYASPLGTGNRTATITVTETSAGGNLSVAPSGLVDGNLSSLNYFFGPWSAGEAIQFDLGSAKKIDQLRWVQDSPGTHGTWVAEASSDAVSWSAVSSNFTLGGGTATTTHDFDLIGAADTYRYYRLRLVTGPVSAGPYLREAEFRVSA